jgi:hypothetical protein
MDPSHEKANPPQEVESLDDTNQKGNIATLSASGDLDVGASLVQNHDTNFTEDGKQRTKCLSPNPAEQFSCRAKKGLEEN